MTFVQIVNTLLLIVPCLLLLLLMFRDRQKTPSFSRVVICLFIYSAAAFLFSHFYLLCNSSILRAFISMLAMFIGIFLFSSLIKYNFCQSIFIIMVTKSYIENIRLLTYYTLFLFTGKLLDISTIWITIVKLIFTVLSFPMVYIFFKKLLRPALDYTIHLATWQLIWIAPVLNNIIFTLMVSPDTSNYGRTPGDTFYFIPPLWFLLTFSTYFLILRVIIAVSENSILQETLQRSEIQITAQQKQNELLRMRIEETSRLRHDMRHHLLVLEGYAKAEDMEGLHTYLHELDIQFISHTLDIYCENSAINVLLCYYKELATRQQTNISIYVSLPDELPFSDTDLCIILGNLLENAVEACKRMKSKDRFIRLKMSMTSRTVLVILIENSYEGYIERTADGLFPSSKSKNRRGIGISSVLDVVKKYNGIPRFEYQNQIFRVSLLLNAKKQP